MKITRRQLKRLINETLQEEPLSEALDSRVAQAIIPKLKIAHKELKEVDRLSKGSGMPLFMKNNLLEGKFAVEKVLKKLGAFR